MLIATREGAMAVLDTPSTAQGLGSQEGCLTGARWAELDLANAKLGQLTDGLTEERVMTGQMTEVRQVKIGAVATLHSIISPCRESRFRGEANELWGDAYTQAFTQAFAESYARKVAELSKPPVPPLVDAKI